MRPDVQIQEIIAKCDVLKRASFWPIEPRLRPRAWLENFDESDRAVAALLLDKFTFYNSRLTDALLVASYNSLADGMPKGPSAPDAATLLASLKDACFAPIEGEKPNPTDSGYFLCRRARQILGVPEESIVSTDVAISNAYLGRPVVFFDDFIGSGDQFLSTWDRKVSGRSFSEAQKSVRGFLAIYITLVCTKTGLDNIHRNAPQVPVCSTHVLDERSTVYGLMNSSQKLEQEIRVFLEKYASRLAPREDYMVRNPSYLRYGYKEHGLMLGFDHSIPDATLPIFWSPGDNNWRPLLERT